ncbi:unnamed protein product [Bursaphelenchus xylophilus]|nr:unnamed protein product [Bursaphelenchus xylophilus]CAG9128932.1 unnamed protein product [Bursaphelenchus xylophilus]
MYSLGFINQVCVLIFDVKYIIIGFERRMAFKNRATYEYSQDGTTIRVFCGIVCTLLLMATAKVGLFLKLRDLPPDLALHKAFMLDSDFATWVFCHTIAVAGWVYGFQTVHELSRRANQTRHTGSLTESFTVKEILNVIKVIKPVIHAYIVVMVIAFTIVMLMLPCIYTGVMDESDMYYQAIVTFEYALLDTYNVFASCYMVWNFKPLRRALKQDITSCFRKKCFSVEVEPESVEKYSAMQGTDLYFEQLTKSWKLDAHMK